MARVDLMAHTRSGHALDIGPLDANEIEPLFEMFAAVVVSGEGYPHSAPLGRESFDATWVRSVTAVVAARVDATLAGAYYLKPNFPGRAAHIANAGYVVDAQYRGEGIGRALVEDSIPRARELGFDAIQFNLVFASNPARPMYENLGWREIGRVPRAVGDEEAIIYWRDL